MTRTNDWKRGPGRGLPWLFSILLISTAVDPATAQVMLIRDAAPSGNEDPNTPGFQIPVDDSLATSFSDFERHSKRGDWELAFRALGEIPANKRTGMLRAPRGMIIPAGHRIWQAIAELPAEGREAFRVFFDARARNLWNDVGQPSRTSAEDMRTAGRVFEEFFLTSVGDDAANYLGDAAFERSEFRDADRYWKAVLNHHPNSDIGELRLQVKRALAQLQLGRIHAFDAIANSVSPRFAGETVTLGGAPVEAVDFLRSMRASYTDAAAGDDSRDSHGDSPALSGGMPEQTETAWRLQFLSEQGQRQLNDAVTNNYWYRNGMETWIPPYAVSGRRLVCNWFGIVFALDGRTGKLLWRNEKFNKVHGQFSQLPHSSANLDQYAVAASDEVVLANWLDPQRLNYYREPFRLIAYEMDSGKEMWNSQKLQPLKETSFVGVPLIVKDEVLVTCHQRNESKLILRSLKLADGSENWSLELGTAQKMRNQRGNEIMPLPHLLKDGQTLYILTNNGALLALDLGKRELLWALKYGGTRTGNSDGVFYSGEIDTATLLHSYGVLLEHDGVLYAKESKGPVVHAIDPAGPSLLWSRPISPEAVLVGADDDHLYLLSRELMAIDRQSQKLNWSRRLPIEGGGLSAVIGEDTIYVGSRRGIYCVSRADGRLRTIFRGADVGAVGAWIDVVGDRLVCVSNAAITAYPVFDTGKTSPRGEVGDTASGGSAPGS